MEEKRIQLQICCLTRIPNLGYQVPFGVPDRAEWSLNSGAGTYAAASMIRITAVAETGGLYPASERPTQGRSWVDFL